MNENILDGLYFFIQNMMNSGYIRLFLHTFYGWNKGESIQEEYNTFISYFAY